MASLPPIVTDIYRYVVGVDTHAATHTYAIVAATTGALLDQATFPTTPAGLRRARDWIGRRTGGDLDGVLVAAEGTGSYGAVLGDVLEAAGYRVVEAPTPRRERGRGKTDAADAVLAARSSLATPLAQLRDRRAGDVQVALQVLTVARDQLNADRLRCINALTALVRSHDLGLDARRALTAPQIATIAGWRRREEPLGAARPHEPKPSGWPSASLPSTTSWPTTAPRWTSSLPLGQPSCSPCPVSARSPPP